MPKYVDHDVRREEIAEAAAMAVAELGIESLTTADVAVRAGCTVGALPHYFGGKDQILLAALQHTSRSVALRGEAAWKRTGGDLVATLAAAMPLDPPSRRDARVWFAFFGRSLTSDAIAEEYRGRFRRLEHEAEILLDGVRLRRGWEKREVIGAAFSFIDGLSMRALVDPQAWSPARQRSALGRQLRLMVISLSGT